MRKRNVIVLSIVSVLIIIAGLLLFFIARKNAENIQKKTDVIYQTVLNMNLRLNNIDNDIEKVQGQISNIGSNEVETSDDEETGRLLNQIFDELIDLRSAQEFDRDKIVFLEKEIIKHIAGVYDEYIYYYLDCGNYSYSVCFPKDYPYEAIEPPTVTEYYGVGASLKIYLDESKDASISIWPWHSFGLSTTAKSATVKTLVTDEGKTAEYVVYDIDDKGHMDFGFEEYTLKISVVYDKENSAGVVGKVFDIVRTITFYDSLYLK